MGDRDQLGGDLIGSCLGPQWFGQGWPAGRLLAADPIMLMPGDVGQAESSAKKKIN